MRPCSNLAVVLFSMPIEKSQLLPRIATRFQNSKRRQQYRYLYMLKLMRMVNDNDFSCKDEGKSRGIVYAYIQISAAKIMHTPTLIAIIKKA